VDADFLARARLADALSNWITSQALFHSRKETFGEKFEDCIPAKFSSLTEVLKVLSSSLFTEVKFRMEDFFRARKACRMRVFSSCRANLRADLVKFSPFSALLFQQSVVDIVLAELQTEDKDPSLAFEKRPFPKLK